MQAIRKCILKRFEPNTFIGGVAATINTANIIAQKLNLSVSRIQGFKVVNNDIEFAVTGGNYDIPNSCFGSGITANANKSITFYRDMSGKVSLVGNESFKFCTNLIDVNFPNAHTILGVLASGSGAFSDCINLNLCIMPNLVLCIGFYNFSNTVLLNTLNVPLLTEIGTGTFDRGCGIVNLNLPSLISMTTQVFNHSGSNTKALTLVCPNATNISGASIQGLTKVKEILLPNITAMNSTNKNGLWDSLTAIELIEAKKLRYLGNPSQAGTNAFRAFKLGCTIRLHIDLLTANAGNADASLVFAKNTRNATIEFYDDNGIYVSTL